MFVYTTQPVVQAVVQPIDNRFYRVNGVLSPVYTIQPVPVVKPVVKPVWQPVVSCKRGITQQQYQRLISLLKLRQQMRKFAIFMDTLLTCAEMQLLRVDRAVNETFSGLHAVWAVFYFAWSERLFDSAWRSQSVTIYAPTRRRGWWTHCADD